MAKHATSAPPKTKAEKKAAHEVLVNSIVVSFDETYGKTDSTLAIWQTLCQDLGVQVGTSITQCRKILRGVYVNIFDFVAAKRVGMAPLRFASVWELREYSRRNGKIFPLRKAKENLMLKALLVHMSGNRR